MEHRETIHTHEDESYCFLPIDIPLYEAQTTRMWNEVIDALESSDDPLDKQLHELIEDITHDHYGSFKTMLNHAKVEQMTDAEKRAIAERLWDTLIDAPCMSLFNQISYDKEHDSTHLPRADREREIKACIDAELALGYSVSYDDRKLDWPKDSKYIDQLEVLNAIKEPA